MSAKLQPSQDNEIKNLEDEWINISDELVAFIENSDKDDAPKKFTLPNVFVFTIRIVFNIHRRLYQLTRDHAALEEKYERLRSGQD